MDIPPDRHEPVDVIGALASIIGRLCMLEPSEVSADRPLADLVVDSVVAAEVVVAAEKRFAVTLDDRAVLESWSGWTVRDLGAAVEARRGSRPPSTMADLPAPPPLE